MSVKKFHEFKSEQLDNSAETNGSKIVKKISKLTGNPKDFISVNDLKIETGETIRIELKDKEHLVFKVDEITDMQMQVECIEASKDLKINQYYMIFVNDLSKKGQFKVYTDFSTNENKWMKTYEFDEIYRIEKIN